MNRADEVRAEAQRRSHRLSATASPTVGATEREPDPEPSRRPAQVVRTKPVKASVNFSPAEHAALVRWCADAAVATGRSRVAGSDVLRLLARRLILDEQLAGLVRDDLRREQ